jgi:hypothetical protein
MRGKCYKHATCFKQLREHLVRASAESAEAVLLQITSDTAVARACMLQEELRDINVAQGY